MIRFHHFSRSFPKFRSLQVLKRRQLLPYTRCTSTAALSKYLRQQRQPYVAVHTQSAGPRLLRGTDEDAAGTLAGQVEGEHRREEHRPQTCRGTRAQGGGDPSDGGNAQALGQALPGDDRPDCPIIDEFANPGDEGAAARDQCPLRSQRAEDGVRWALAAWIQTFASQRPGRPC